jgi:hypothetical protein
MRIDPATLSSISDGAPTSRLGLRALRIRTTLQSGLYTVDLDQLAARLAGQR